MDCAEGRGRMAGLKRADPPENVKRGEVGNPLRRGVVAVRAGTRGEDDAEGGPAEDTGRGAREDARGTGEMVDGPALVDGRTCAGDADTGNGVEFGIAMGYERDLAGVSPSGLGREEGSAGSCATE